MNYILSQLDRKIAYLKASGRKAELKVHYQSKFEFILNYILGYLWNKNWERISASDKEYIIGLILKPSIGSVVAISRKLDVDAEFFGNKKLKRFYQSIDEYPTIRNEKIGHGFSFEDDSDSFIETLEALLSKIEDSQIDILSTDVDLVFVEGVNKDIFYGTSFKPDGATYTIWTCPSKVNSFIEKSLYIFDDDKYFRISPFISLEEENEIFVFCSIEEKLTGRVKYNKLLKTGTKLVDVSELRELNITNEPHKRRTGNGTIINNFENNYIHYIDVGITKRILDFLTSNKSSVFATLWGHGGVGKTASIQHVCEILCNQERKVFDYIIFLSAKDRFYNYYQGKIQSLEESVSSYYQIIQSINFVINNVESFDTESIINYQGKILIIIDDFETFSKSEKANIITFIKGLNINHHKLILTTRAATLVTGEEIQTKELGEDETISFLEAALENELPSFGTSMIKKDLEKKAFRTKIHEVTSGRPLFILQFAILLGQKSNLSEAVKHDIKSTDAAKNFLYDRIYDYLSIDAKNMFLAISLLVNEDDLSGLTDSLNFY